MHSAPCLEKKNMLKCVRARARVRAGGRSKRRVRPRLPVASVRPLASGTRGAAAAGAEAALADVSSDERRMSTEPTTADSGTGTGSSALATAALQAATLHGCVRSCWL